MCMIFSKEQFFLESSYSYIHSGSLNFWYLGPKGLCVCTGDTVKKILKSPFFGAKIGISEKEC